MTKYIKADDLVDHKFSDVTFDRYVSDGKPKSEKEIYAYKVGYNDAIDRILKFVQPAKVVNRKVYELVLDQLCTVREQLETEKQLVRDLITELGRRYEHN